MVRNLPELSVPAAKENYRFMPRIGPLRRSGAPALAVCLLSLVLRSADRLSCIVVYQSFSHSVKVCRFGQLKNEMANFDARFADE